MNIVDVILLAWLIFAVIRGYRIGLIRQTASFAGFLLGLFAGGWVASVFLGAAQDTGTKLIISLVVVFGLGLLMAGLFEMLAMRLQRMIRLNLAQTLNAILGAVFSAGATFVLAWVLLSALNRLPLAEAGLSISESGTYKVMEQMMPPAPDVLGQLNHIITPYGFPQIFIGGEPQSAPAAPPASADVEAAAAKARQSVVRIEGYTCGDIATGSGFIAAPGFVATNAHVIAGVDAPVVVRGNEKYRGVPVLFDDKLDFAVLRVEGLSAPVLPLDTDAPEQGQSGAVLGYPGGGPLTVVPGVMQARYEAVGRDIYGQGLVTREIYEIHASIHPGNSGGPFVLPDGSVAGVMFGASTTQNTASYAITATEVVGELRQAIASDSPAATGNCL
jgi:S1-C subfamily serine protease